MLPTNSPISSNDSGEVCPICGGLGYVRYDLPVGHPNFGKLVRCPGQHHDLDQKRRESLRRLGNLDAYHYMTFDTFKTDLPELSPIQRESLETALRFAMDYAENPVGWLLLEGTYGCGKTHLAAAVGNTRVEREDSVLFVTSPDLLDYLRTTFDPSSDVTYDEMFDRLRNAPLLILDDLGVEKPSPWAQEKLFQLFNHRYSRQLPTVVTTNADLDDLDPRVRSRLLDLNVIKRVKISAPDYRSAVKNQRDQLTDLGMYADMRFETFDVTSNLHPQERRGLEIALAEARHYAENPQGWLLLTGPYGSGKTHLAASIANAQTERSAADFVFVTAPDLLDYLRATYGPDAPGSFDRRFHAIRNTGLLVLDEVGTENPSAWAKEKLFQVINHRYVARLPTVMTTSKPLDQLDPRLRTRVMDKRLCTVFPITAPDYASRLRRK